MNKLLLATLIAGLACSTAHASHDYNAIIRDGIIGGVIGGIIGNNTGDGDSKTGALIGATTSIIKGIDSRNGTTHSGYTKSHNRTSNHVHYDNIAIPPHHRSGYDPCNKVRTHVTYHKVWVHASETVINGRVIRLHDGYWKYVPHVSRSGY